MAYEKVLNIYSFNCNGIKSCVNNLVHELQQSSDVIFVSEHWLQVYEISPVKNIFRDSGYTSYLKSSMDPEEPLIGRPHGGVGFLCKLVPGLMYKHCDIMNDRVCHLKILSSVDKNVLLNESVSTIP